MFVLLIVVGSIAVMATYDVPRTASLPRTAIPAGGEIPAGLGTMGALAFVEQRWPRARGWVRLAWLAMGAIFVAVSFTDFDRALSLASMQTGVWSIFQAVFRS